MIKKKAGASSTLIPFTTSVDLEIYMCEFCAYDLQSSISAEQMKISVHPQNVIVMLWVYGADLSGWEGSGGGGVHHDAVYVPRVDFKSLYANAISANNYTNTEWQSISKQCYDYVVQFIKGYIVWKRGPSGGFVLKMTFS